MNCRKFKREQLNIELGLAERSTAGLDHGRECSDCRRWVARQRLIDQSFLIVRRYPSPAVNVVKRVSEGIRHGTTHPSRTERWSLIALPLTGVAMLFGLWQSGIRIQPALETAVRALLLCGRLAENLWSPFAAMLRAAGRLCLALFTAMANAFESLGSLEPWFVGTAALCTLMMATSVMLVVGRDIGRQRPEREDRH